MLLTFNVKRAQHLAGEEDEDESVSFHTSIKPNYGGHNQKR